MKNVWFTSDTHFGHQKIPLYSRREFCLTESELYSARQIWENNSQRISTWTPSPESLSRMDDYLIDQINKNVAPDDILWHLGDFCFWKRTDRARFAKSYREKILCQNFFLIAGNHDSSEIRSVFDGYFDHKEIKVHSKTIVLNHYAHCFWNRSHYGSWMLYGHAHGNAEEWLDFNMPGRLSMDVGVDNAFRVLGEYRPFSFQEIANIMHSRRGFHPDKNNFTTPRSRL
jgi:calcineurin-like phosphoesterase family protein